jgi:hypothetical protein
MIVNRDFFFFFKSIFKIEKNGFQFFWCGNCQGPNNVIGWYIGIFWMKLLGSRIDNFF